MSNLKRHLPDTLYVWFLLTLIVPNAVLSITEHLGLWSSIANVALPLGIYGLVASLSTKIGRTVWLMFPFIFLAAFQMVLLGLYGRSVIAVDMFLNVLTTNASEAGELLNSLWPWIGLVCILYLPSLILAGVIIARNGFMTRPFQGYARRISAAIAAVGVIGLIGAYASPRPYAVTDDLYPLNAAYNIYLAADRSVKTARYHSTSASFTFDAVAEHSDSVRELYVMIIGETSRAADWQLSGYERPTNPRLSRRSDIFAAPQAYSESNTTHKSVPMLLSTLDASTFDADIYRVKSVITAFKEAGFATAFLSNQRRNHSFIDFFGEEADTTLFVRDSEDYDPSQGDFTLIPEMERIIAQANPKQLIVLHTYGSHFNYIDRYGKEDELFLPTDYDEAMPDYRPELVNAYDNSIVATDRLLDTIITRLESVPGQSWMIYASDHGEDIFDNGSHRFLHASPMPSETQVRVPMVIWLSPTYRLSHPRETHAMRDNMAKVVSSSRSYTPTALSLGGIATPRLDLSASLAREEYRPVSLIYLNDHNKSVSLISMLK